MKKIFLTMLGVCAMLCSTSCSDEEIVVSGEGEAMVELTVALNDGSDASRAISDGKTVDKVYYEVYASANDGTQTLMSALKDSTNLLGGEEGNKYANISLALVKGQSYNIVFWASKAGVYNTGDLSAITVAGEGSPANDESKDAFTAVYRTAKVTGPIKETIKLTRPFAQVNFGTLDVEAAKKAGITFDQSQITVSNAATTYNALTEEANAEGSELTFVWADVPNMETEALVVGNDTYEYLATAYVLVPGDDTQKLSDLKMEIETGLNEIITLSVPTAPVQRNYRTNVLGNLLTNTAEFNVVVDPIYAGDKESIMIWDGKSTNKPEYDEETKTYSVKSAEELAWIANLVNGTLPAESRSEMAPAETLAGVTVKLTDDINLANQSWTPIGNSAHSFQGTFDGNGKTIHNLNVQMAGKSDAGLFGVTQNGEIKNLTVSNATVVGRLNVGVVAGTPYTSKYTNITVKGLVQVEGMAYVGGVGGKNAYANWDNVKVEAADGSYVKANSVENGKAYRTYVGGVVGFNGEGGHSFTNITSNINVEGTTCDVGGLFGIAHYGNKFENCVCKGNVTITDASEAADAQEIGGIAGVWHNGGADVVLTNCSFEGELSTNIAVEYYYGGLVGKPYSETGTGKLIINGDVVVATATQLQAALDAATGESTIKLGADIKGDVTVLQKNGVNITIDGAQHKYDGVITVNGNGRSTGAETLKFTEINFETEQNDFTFVSAPSKINNKYNYSHNVTFEKCTFTGNQTVGSASFTGTYNFVMKDCVATNMHSLLQTQSCDNTVLVENVKTVNCKNGVSFGNTAYPTLKNSTIVANEYGVRGDGDASRGNLVVENTTISAKQPIIIRKVKTDGYAVALGESVALNTEEAYHIVFTNGSDDVEYVKPTGTYTLTGADGYKVFPAPVEVASWEDFTNALNAGETNIKLTDNITYDQSYELKKNVTIDLNGKALEISNPSLMLSIHSNATVKNGTIKGKVYARTGADIKFEGVTFGGTINGGGSTEGLLQVQNTCDVYAKECTFNATNSNTQKSRPLSVEGRSSGTLKFENCSFKSNTNQNQVYVNPMSGTATIDFTNCNFNNKTPNIMFAAACPLTNLTMTGTTKLSSVTLEINRAKDAVTEADWAHISTLIANNSFSSVRLFYAGGSSESIR